MDEEALCGNATANSHYFLLFFYACMSAVIKCDCVYLKVMAIKDKHGRHITGSDKEVKECIDYVVFERHLTNRYGVWKVCGKLHPFPQRTNTGKHLARTAPLP